MLPTEPRLDGWENEGELSIVLLGTCETETLLIWKNEKTMQEFVAPIGTVGERGATFEFRDSVGLDDNF